MIVAVVVGLWTRSDFDIGLLVVGLWNVCDFLIVDSCCCKVVFVDLLFFCLLCLFCLACFPAWCLPAKAIRGLGC